jgi:hypothetical protein
VLWSVKFVSFGKPVSIPTTYYSEEAKQGWQK